MTPPTIPTASVVTATKPASSATAQIQHVAGEVIQMAAAGGLVAFGVPAKYAFVAWAIGKVLSLFGVRGISLPDTPPPSV